MEIQKKLRFDVGLLHIDESCVCGDKFKEQYNEVTGHVVNVMKESNLPYHVVKLEKVDFVYNIVRMSLFDN